jgi:hypothetical protein
MAALVFATVGAKDCDAETAGLVSGMAEAVSDDVGFRERRANVMPAAAPIAINAIARGLVLRLRAAFDAGFLSAPAFVLAMRQSSHRPRCSNSTAFCQSCLMVAARPIKRGAAVARRRPSV